jgi:hypothetical protein
VLLSETTRAIVADDLPDGVELHALGDQRLRDIDRPEPLHELRIDDVPTTPTTAPDPEPSAPMPGWLQGSIATIGERTSELIERRVLAELTDALSGRDAGIASDHPKPPQPPARGSVSDEIARLQALRDSGALTDEQYARAVDRAIEGS